MMERIVKALRRALGLIATKSFVDGAQKGEELAIRKIENSSIERLLDVGCADGTATIEFSARVGAKEVYGIDYDMESLKKAELLGITGFKLDMNRKWDIESDYFDVILSRFSFEHLHYTRTFLTECYRCLKSGGKLVIVTENLSSWINIFVLMFGWQPFSLTQFDGWWIGNPLAWRSGDIDLERSFDKWEDTGISGIMGHVRVLSFKGMEDLLVKAGFKEVNASTRGYLPLWGRISDALCNIDRRHGHILVAVCSK